MREVLSADARIDVVGIAHDGLDALDRRGPRAARHRPRSRDAEPRRHRRPRRAHASSSSARRPAARALIARAGIHLFTSAARTHGAGVVAIVLTGMGSDGLEGARAVRAAGGTVLVEASETCIVYGMPRAVEEAGLASLTADSVWKKWRRPSSIASERRVPPFARPETVTKAPLRLSQLRVHCMHLFVSCIFRLEHARHDVTTSRGLRSRCEGVLHSVRPLLGRPCATTVAPCHALEADPSG